MTYQMQGIGSGLDVGTIVTALVAVQQQPITALQNKQTQINSASQTISTLSSQLASLKTAAMALSTTAGYTSNTATSSDPSIAVSASGSGTPGQYSVSVSALAHEQRTYSTAQSSDSAALGLAGTFSLAVGAGAAVNVNVTAGDSLTSIASKISSSGARVTASVLFDGTNYRLQVRGMDSGAANALTMTESGFSLGLSNPANTYQHAQDASLSLDGISITRPTNSISDVVPGVTLALTNTTTTPATIQVSSDPTGLAQKINTFLSAYNTVVKTGHAATGFGTAAASNSVLAGDPAIHTTLESLSRLVGSAVPGAASKFPTLGSIGVSLTNDGTLTLDSAKLNAALANDPNSVQRLFVTDANSGSTGIMASIGHTIDTLSTQAGSLLQSKIQAYSTESRDMDTTLNDMTQRMQNYSTQLQARFAALDQQVGQYRYVLQSISSLTGNTNNGNSNNGSGNSSGIL